MRTPTIGSSWTIGMDLESNSRNCTESYVRVGQDIFDLLNAAFVQPELLWVLMKREKANEQGELLMKGLSRPQACGHDEKDSWPEETAKVKRIVGVW